jgi:hypothetical protein
MERGFCKWRCGDLVGEWKTREIVVRLVKKLSARDGRSVGMWMWFLGGPEDENIETVPR